MDPHVKEHFSNEKTERNFLSLNRTADTKIAIYHPSLPLVCQILGSIFETNADSAYQQECDVLRLDILVRSIGKMGMRQYQLQCQLFKTGSNLRPASSDFLLPHNRTIAPASTLFHHFIDDECTRIKDFV